MPERLLIERLLNPKPIEQRDLTGFSQDDTVGESLQLFNNCFLHQGILHVWGHFGKYEPKSFDEGSQALDEYIRSCFWISQQHDASRSIGLINLKIFHNTHRIPTVRYNHLFQLEVGEWTGLGDGSAVFTQGNGWSMTQKKGQHFSQSQFVAYSPRS